MADTAASSTSAMGTARPSSAVERGDALVGNPARDDQVEVTAGRSSTLNANPWLVIQREIRTPMAASLSVAIADPDAGQARRYAPPATPNAAAVADQHLFEIAHVAVHIAPVGVQVDDGVADELAGAVVRDVAAAARSRRSRHLRAREPPGDASTCDRSSRVLTPSVMTGGCSQEQQQIGNAIRSALLDEALLQLECVRVGNEPETADLESALRATLLRSLPAALS